MKNSLETKANEVFERCALPLSTLAAFFLPIKFSFTLPPLILLILIWAARDIKKLPQVLASFEYSHLRALYLFILIAGYSSIFGLDFPRSFASVLSLTFYAMTPIAVAESLRGKSFLCVPVALLCGQTISSLHSVIEAAFPSFIPTFFIGKVTESGQLALTFIVALGLLFYLRSKEREEKGNARLENLNTWRIFAFALFLSLGVVAFSNSLALELWQKLSILALVGAIYILHAISAWQFVARGSPRLALTALILSVSLPSLAATLLVNLKRGPWAGVLVGMLIFLSMFSRKRVIPGILMVACIFCFVPPVRERLLQSYDHFSITGGREAIWNIGTELAMRYPLGIGLENSPVLRKFSTEIPPQLRHFHNNLLNIWVETGWLGLCTFIWWLYCVFRSSWTVNGGRALALASRTMGCALLSWQVAGIVEYNFGDSEVLLIAFMLLGVLAAIRRDARQHAKMPRNEVSKNGDGNFHHAPSNELSAFS